LYQRLKCRNDLSNYEHKFLIRFEDWMCAFRNVMQQLHLWLGLECDIVDFLNRAEKFKKLRLQATARTNSNALFVVLRSDTKDFIKRMRTKFDIE